jgi:hypothetical protein
MGYYSSLQRNSKSINPLPHGGSYMAQSDFFYFRRSVNVGIRAIYSGQVVCLLIKVFEGRFCHLGTILRSQGACFVLPSWWSGLFGLLTFHLRISAIYIVHRSKKKLHLWSGSFVVIFYKVSFSFQQ